MKKPNLYIILPLAAASLPFTGCTTTEKASAPVRESYTLGSVIEKEDQTSQRNLLKSQNVNTPSLEPVVSSIYGDQNLYGAQSLFSENDYSEFGFSEPKYTEDTDVITFIDSMSLAYVPDLGGLYKTGSKVSARTQRYTKISKKTPGGFDFDTDIDVWNPDDSKVELSKKFRNGSKLVIEASPDDKKYAEVVFSVPWLVAVKPIQAMVAWVKY
jgi:hypothetical protein